MFIENLQAPHYTTGWGNGGASNQDWPVILGGPYQNLSVVWYGAVPDRPDYMPRNPENVRTAARHVCDDSLHCRRRERMRIPSTSRNPVLNPRVNHCGDDRDIPVDQ